MNPTAYVLFQFLLRQPDKATILMEELTIACRTSKTAVRQAVAELEAEGLVNLTRDV